MVTKARIHPLGWALIALAGVATSAWAALLLEALI